MAVEIGNTYKIKYNYKPDNGASAGTTWAQGFQYFNVVAQNPTEAAQKGAAVLLAGKTDFADVLPANYPATPIEQDLPGYNYMMIDVTRVETSENIVVISVA